MQLLLARLEQLERSCLGGVGGSGEGGSGGADGSEGHTGVHELVSAGPALWEALRLLERSIRTLSDDAVPEPWMVANIASIYGASLSKITLT